MPTSRPRHAFTETDELRELLDRARAHFPAAPSRKALLAELLRLGDAELRRREAAERREAGLRYLADVSTGRKPGLDFEDLKRVRHEEWPDDVA
jgi:hypothetical protein